MAEIPIQRKEGHAVWPWVLLGLIILAAVLWFVYAHGATTTATAARADSAAVANGAVTTDSTAGATTPGASRVDSAQRKLGP